MRRTPKQTAMGALLDEGANIMDYIKQLDNGSMRLKDGTVPAPEYAAELIVRLKDLYRENRDAYDWLNSMPEPENFVSSR